MSNACRSIATWKGIDIRIMWWIWVVFHWFDAPSVQFLGAFVPSTQAVITGFVGPLTASSSTKRSWFISNIKFHQFLSNKSTSFPEDASCIRCKSTRNWFFGFPTMYTMVWTLSYGKLPPRGGLGMFVAYKFALWNRRCGWLHIHHHPRVHPRSSLDRIDPSIPFRSFIEIFPSFDRHSFL